MNYYCIVYFFFEFFKREDFIFILIFVIRIFISKFYIVMEVEVMKKLLYLIKNIRLG